MKKKLRVGVVGLGRIFENHIMSIEFCKDVEFVACCDIIEELTKKIALKYNVNGYVDYKEMIDKEKLDVLHILLPHYLHVPVAIYAMEKGVNVLSEKPMAIDYDSAVKAVELSEKLNLKYGVIFQCRYNNSAKFIKETLQSGKLGKILSVRSILTWERNNDYYAESDWKGTWDKEGGGVIINQCIHTVDLVNYMVDSPVKSVEVTMSNRIHPTIKVEDTAEGLVTFENGVKYVFYATNNYSTNLPIEVSIYCEKGVVKFDYNDAIITYNDGSVEEAHQTTYFNYGDKSKDYWGVQHVNQIRQFYNAVLGIEDLDMSGRKALSTHKLICDIYNEGKKNFHN